MKRPYHQYPFAGWPNLNGIVWGLVGSLVFSAVILVVWRLA